MPDLEAQPALAEKKSWLVCVPCPMLEMGTQAPSPHVHPPASGRDIPPCTD